MRAAELEALREMALANGVTIGDLMIATDIILNLQKQYPARRIESLLPQFPSPSHSTVTDPPIYVFYE